MEADVKKFRMPRYAEVPAIGLYLDQTAKYINEVFAPLRCVEVTPSMISNYVKKKYISKPVRKLYGRDQITCLMFIVLAKLALSMDNIDIFLKMERFNPIREKEYDRFCEEFEKMILFVFGMGEKAAEEDLQLENDEVRFIHSLMTAIAYYVYLNACFLSMRDMLAAEDTGSAGSTAPEGNAEPRESKRHRTKPAARQKPVKR